MKQHGKVYDAVYLTDEEKIVIDALRAGATAKVNFHDWDYEDVVRHTDQLPSDVFPKRRIVDYRSSRVHYFGVEQSSKNVELTYFINAKSH